MGVTVSNVQIPRPPGAERRVTKEVTFDSSYAEGGEELTAKQLELKKVTYAHCHILNGTEVAEKWVYAASYTPATNKIHLHDVKTGKELAKEVNCEKLKVLVVAYGF